MRRTTAVSLGAPLLAALAVMGGVLVRSTGTDPASPEAPAGAAATPRPGSVPGSTDPGRAGDVTWSAGPWGEVTVAGHRLLIPASREHGPFRDRNGWASDYAPTPQAAAIAVLRGPWFVFAAPAELRAQVVAAVLTPAAAGEPGPVNPSTVWAIPGELLAGLAAQDVQLLGAKARLTGEGRAEVDVYQRVTDTNGPQVVRSTHRLTYADRQWLIEADYSDSAGQEISTATVPTPFTIAAPGVGP